MQAKRSAAGKIIPQRRFLLNPVLAYLLEFLFFFFDSTPRNPASAASNVFEVLTPPVPTVTFTLKIPLPQALHFSLSASLISQLRPHSFILFHSLAILSLRIH